MLAVDTYATAFMFVVSVERASFTFDVFVVVARIGMVMTVTFDAFVVVVALGMGPLALVEKRQTFAAGYTLGIVFAFACQFPVILFFG